MGDVESRTVTKVVRRFLPILVICFILSFLDRVNVGFAALTMSKDLGFSGTVFGLGAGLFFIGYFLFEVPSNMALERFGARMWMFRIMITWGILSAATAFVWNDWSFYGMRFLLGIAEAGFFPGIAFYFTLWLPSRHRGRVNSIFLAAMPFASVIGGPISGYLLTLDGLFGLHGWQLLYLVEACPRSSSPSSCWYSCAMSRRVPSGWSRTSAIGWWANCARSASRPRFSSSVAWPTS